MIVSWWLSSIWCESEMFAVGCCFCACCTSEFGEVVSLFIVFRCSENFLACRDSTGEPVEFSPPGEFCVSTAFTTIGRTPPTVAPPLKAGDAFGTLLLLSDMMFESLTSFGIIDDNSIDVVGVDETFSGIPGREFMCLPHRNTILRDLAASLPCF